VRGRAFAPGVVVYWGELMSSSAARPFGCSGLCNARLKRQTDRGRGARDRGVEARPVRDHVDLVLTRELRYRPDVVVARVPVRVHVHGRAAPLRTPVTRS